MIINPDYHKRYAQKSDDKTFPAHLNSFLMYYAEHGDYHKARDLIDSFFWSGNPLNITWDYLKPALIREDRAMMKLLITWGATATGEQLAELQADKHDHYTRLLRNCGLKLRPLVPGARMQDGSLYLGLHEGVDWYAAAEDEKDADGNKLCLSFNDAVQYAHGVKAHGHNDWQMPNDTVMKMLVKNKSQGGFQGTFEEDKGRGYIYACTSLFKDRTNVMAGISCAFNGGRGLIAAIHAVKMSGFLRCVRAVPRRKP